MADSSWYYVLGDAEKGPISTEALLVLIASGKLGAADLVWKDSMADWAMISSLPDLREQAAAAASPVEPPPPPPHHGNSSPLIRAEDPRRHVIRSVQSRREADVLALAKLFGRPLVVCGLLMVLGARGCDSVGDRYVARQQARSSVTRTRFQDRWDQLRKEIQKDEKAIQSKELRTSEDNEQLAELAQRLEKLNREMAKKRQELEAGDWSELEIAARDSEANNKLWAYWRGLFFVFGAMVLSLGLLAVGFTSQGPERWVCLVMLAVITYSLFVGGKNW